MAVLLCAIMRDGGVLAFEGSMENRIAKDCKGLQKVYCVMARFSGKCARPL
jgi:hypothetical protein